MDGVFWKVLAISCISYLLQPVSCGEFLTFEAKEDDTLDVVWRDGANLLNSCESDVNWSLQAASLSFSKCQDQICRCGYLYYLDSLISQNCKAEQPGQWLEVIQSRCSIGPSQESLSSISDDRIEGQDAEARATSFVTAYYPNNSVFLSAIPALSTVSSGDQIGTKLLHTYDVTDTSIANTPAATQGNGREDNELEPECDVEDDEEEYDEEENDGEENYDYDENEEERYGEDDEDCDEEEYEDGDDDEEEEGEGDDEEEDDDEEEEEEEEEEDNDDCDEETENENESNEDMDEDEEHIEENEKCDSINEDEGCEEENGMKDQTTDKSLEISKHPPWYRSQSTTTPTPAPQPKLYVQQPTVTVTTWIVETETETETETEIEIQTETVFTTIKPVKRPRFCLPNFPPSDNEDLYAKDTVTITLEVDAFSTSTYGTLLGTKNRQKAPELSTPSCSCPDLAVKSSAVSLSQPWLLACMVTTLSVITAIVINAIF